MTESRVSASYTSGDYLQLNPTWHAEDSPWKAAHILRMIERHGLRAECIAEVGCGVGEVLNQLHSGLRHEPELHGYEISPQAHALARRRVKPRLHFHLADLTEVDDVFDLVLVIDVFEHVEDYLGFLRALRPRASQFIFHIPLDLSAQTVVRRQALLATRHDVGHLHYFTEETALATLRDTGYVVDDRIFTARGVELGGGGIKRNLARLPRRLVAGVSESLASRLLGGFSLLVLAHSAER